MSSARHLGAVALAVVFMLLSGARLAYGQIQTKETFDELTGLPDFGDYHAQNGVVISPEGGVLYYDNCRVLTNSPAVVGDNTTVLGTSSLGWWICGCLSGGIRIFTPPSQPISAVSFTVSYSMARTRISRSKWMPGTITTFPFHRSSCQ